MNSEHEQWHEDRVTQYTVAETEDYIWGVLNILPLHIRCHQLRYEHFSDGVNNYVNIKEVLNWFKLTYSSTFFINEHLDFILAEHKKCLQMSATMCSGNVTLQYILLISTKHTLWSQGIISDMMCLFKM